MFSIFFWLCPWHGVLSIYCTVSVFPLLVWPSKFLIFLLTFLIINFCLVGWENYHKITMELWCLVLFSWNFPFRCGKWIMEKLIHELRGYPVRNTLLKLTWDKSIMPTLWKSVATNKRHIWSVGAVKEKHCDSGNQIPFSLNNPGINYYKEKMWSGLWICICRQLTLHDLTFLICK